MNRRRGYESSWHLEAKIEVGDFFDARGWHTFYEQQNTDVVIRHYTTGFIAAIEVEASPKNVTRNIERDIANGCNAVAVLSLNIGYLGQILNKIMASETARHHGRVRAFPMDVNGFQELLDWLDELTRTHSSFNQQQSKEETV
jgi:hypothetical protein